MSMMLVWSTDASFAGRVSQTISYLDALTTSQSEPHVLGFRVQSRASMHVVMCRPHSIASALPGSRIV